jgi:hypothetical protein
MKDSRPFAKLKEVFPQPTSRHKNTTFNFARPHPKPTHHPTSGRLTIDNLEVTMTQLHLFSTGKKVDLENLKYYIA